MGIVAEESVSAETRVVREMRSECFFVPDRTEVLALAEIEGGRMEKCAWGGREVLVRERWVSSSYARRLQLLRV